MDDQLKLILSLITEVNELIKLRDEEENKYNTIETSIDEAFNNIQKMNELSKKMKEKFENAKSSKIFKFGIPCGIGTFIITFTILIMYGDFPDGLLNIILSGICSCVSGTAVSCVPVMILNMFDSFFIKKYSDIKQIHDKINNLNNSIMLSERNLEKMKADRDSIYTTLKFRGEQLSRKKEEFYEVTRTYFNSLEVESIMIEKERSSSNIVEHGKTKVRVLDKNEKLDPFFFI